MQKVRSSYLQRHSSRWGSGLRKGRREGAVESFVGAAGDGEEAGAVANGDFGEGRGRGDAWTPIIRHSGRRTLHSPGCARPGYRAKIRISRCTLYMHANRISPQRPMASPERNRLCRPAPRVQGGQRRRESRTRRNRGCTEGIKDAECRRYRRSRR